MFPFSKIQIKGNRIQQRSSRIMNQNHQCGNIYQNERRHCFAGVERPDKRYVPKQAFDNKCLIQEFKHEYGVLGGFPTNLTESRLLYRQETRDSDSCYSRSV
jgi:hypothetical protein